MNDEACKQLVMLMGQQGMNIIYCLLYIVYKFQRSLLIVTSLSLNMSSAASLPPFTSLHFVQSTLADRLMRMQACELSVNIIQITLRRFSIPGNPPSQCDYTF